MIRELLIENFAIIEHSRIEFNEGMSVLTGETGAGKSIIIDAIGQLLGQRAKPSMIKSGQDKAYIEAMIEIDEQESIKNILDEAHIDYEDDLLYVSKEILSSGKSICKINYRNVPASLLRQIMPKIIDIHSQFDNAELLNNKNYLSLLDDYCGEEIKALLIEYKENYNHYTKLLKKKKDLENEEENYEQLDFYQSQLDEINQFDFENESVEDLEEEKKQLQTYETIQKAVAPFQQYMQKDEGALPNLYLAIKTLEDITDIDEFNEYYHELYDLYYKIEDITEKVLDTYHSLDYDEYRFNEIQNKLFIIQRLKRKYGASITSILEKKKYIEDKIQFLNNREQVLFDLDKEISVFNEKCYDLADKIHQLRHATALTLSNQITGELKLLYMENASFEIAVVKSNLHSKGFDEVEFMISTNLGQPKQPVSTIASGGELSRIMLSLKTILLEKTSISTIIFDEVDTGVSGKVAFAIGQKMKRIAKNKQVLCITHLPQVACFASTHLYVSKYIENNDTKTRTDLLNEEERVKEIAKMLSGDKITADALKQAKTLLEQVAAL